MRMKLIGQVTEGQNAQVHVTGGGERAYITVHLRRANVEVPVSPVPEKPKDSGQRRVVAAIPPGQGFNVASAPPWKMGDEVTFTLFDKATDTQQDELPSVLVL